MTQREQVLSAKRRTLCSIKDQAVHPCRRRNIQEQHRQHDQRLGDGARARSQFDDQPVGVRVDTTRHGAGEEAARRRHGAGRER